MILESKFLYFLLRGGDGRVDISRDDLPRKLLLEPAHGGLHFRADGSTGKEEVGHDHGPRRGLFGSGRRGEDGGCRESAEPDQKGSRQRSDWGDLHGTPPGRRVAK